MDFTIATVWKNTSKNNKVYYSGELMIAPDKVLKVYGFPRATKNGQNFIELKVQSDDRQGQGQTDNQTWDDNSYPPDDGSNIPF